MPSTGQKHLIIGAGEIGKALQRVLKPHGIVDIRDVKSSEEEDRYYDVLHICYPAIKKFVQVTKKYIKQYKPQLVIIHSTVAVGTTRKIAPFAVHSPVRGVHPHLEEGIGTFVKYFGGEKSKEAAKIFSVLGILVQVFPEPETCELLKILDTTYYGWNIVFAKEAERICQKLNLKFEDVYVDPNISYNEGYRKLGKPNVVRPVLVPMAGKIGGHCVIPNCKLFPTWLTRIIKRRNEQY
ncbi:MAG TPA: hypothetical protein PLQ44_00120 [Candidatus Paceibacterota bacterium]|nr:hypothetical protein [Candidatus Paceibacterota bacterium]HPT40009.1 hypothetical protein [Candidatus Paceibacterota bacterium]